MSKIILSPADFRASYEFARTAVQQKHQSKRDFGSALQRNNTDQIADITEGKLSETACSRFFRNMSNISFDVDFNHYPGLHHIDSGSDIETLVYENKKYICSYKIDIKSTRNYSKWLLVEGHKFWASAFILVKVDLPRDFERSPQSCINNKITCEICGFCYYYDLIDPRTKAPYFLYNSNDQLWNYPPNIKSLCGSMKEASDIIIKNNTKLNVYLKSKTNYGIPIPLLRNSSQEWSELFRAIINSSIAANT